MNWQMPDLLHKNVNTKVSMDFFINNVLHFSTWNMILTQTMDSCGNNGPNSLDFEKNQIKLSIF